MKLGIAGTGMIVQEALPIILQVQPQRVILMGRASSQERTKHLCGQYDLDGYVLDFDSLLQSDVDTIYIALPNQLHYESAKQALLAGKHVLLEKPAVTRKREMEELLSIAAERGILFAEAMTLHYLPAWQSLKEHLAQIGEVKLVNFQFCQYSSRYDAFRRGEIFPSFDPACAGGAFMDLNVYNLHAIVSLFGMPQSVVYYPNMECGVDTSGILQMDYGKFKAVSVAAKDCQAPVGSTVQGTKACIRIPVSANKVDRYEIIGNDGNVQEYDFSCGEHRMYREFLAFSRMIDTGDFSGAQEPACISLQVAEIIETVRNTLPAGTE